MNFDNKTITYAGANLLAHSDAIQKATVIDSVIISSNSPSNSSDNAKLSFDDFGNYKEFPVVNIRQQDNVFQPEAIISNEGITRDFPLIMVGLKAHTDGENNSSIIAVAIDKSSNPFTIPKQSNVPYKLYLDLPIGYSNSNNIIMNVNNAGMVTMDDVDHAISIAIDSMKNDISTLKDQMKNKVSFDGGKITTGNGTFVPASVDDVESAKSKTLLFRKRWEGDLKDLVNELPGFYEIGGGINNGGPEGFNGYGSALLYKTSSDSFIILSDNGSRHWFGHQATYGWTGWNEVADKQTVENALASKVSFDGGKITTGNGTFVPASIGDVVRDNHDGSISYNGNNYSINKTINSSTDYNTITDTGTYLCILSGKWPNTPLDGTGINATVILKVENDNAGDVFQTAYAPAIYKSITRQYSFGKWSAWQQSLIQSDVDNINKTLASKVSFDGGKITTGYGSFVPASVETLQGIIDKSFQYHGKWTSPMADFNNALSGIYQLDLSNTDAGKVLNGWDGYGAAIVYNNGVDCYVTIYGHNGLQWNNHTINGKFVAWQSLPTQSDVTNLQSQINANASNDMRYRGEWNNKGLWDLKNQPDGVYWVSYNDKDVLPGWNKVNSMVTKTSIPSGCLLRLTDSVGNEWITNNFTNNTFFTWVKLN